MYHSGISAISVPGSLDVANSHILVTDISNNGAKQILFTATTPWNTIVPDDFATEGDRFRWTDQTGNYILMMEILSVNESQQSVNIRLISFAKVSTNYFSIVTTGLPTSAIPGQVLSYNFRVTNITSSQTNVRWIIGSQESIGTGTFSDWIEPEQLESLPPSTTYPITIVRNKNCWYEDWVSGPCSNGQTIMPSGYINIPGSLTVQSPAGKRENVTLAVFVRIPGFWQTVAPGGPGGDEYVLSYFGDSVTNISILSEPCDTICVENNLYSQIRDPATGLCIQDALIPPSPNPACQTIGNISFDSSPQGAEIWLAPYGQEPTYRGVQTPNIISNLPAGTYSYILKRFNYENYPVTSSATTEVLANDTVSISAPLIPIPGTVYQFGIKLDSETTGQYISDTIDKFKDLFNSMILSKFSIIVSSVVYDLINHTIIIEVEDIPTLGTNHLNTTYGATLQTEYLETLQRERIETLRLEFPTFYSNYHNYNNYHGSNVGIQSLVFPVVAMVIIELIPYIAILIGWGVAYMLFGGPKIVSQTLSNLQITVKMSTNGSQVVPTKDVTIEIDGQKFTANAANDYMVTIQNLKIGKTYPIKAYIPLVPDSKVYQASFDGNKLITDGMNTITIALKMDTLQSRDWKLCDLKLDGNPMPTGTIIRVYRIKTSENGTPTFDTLGTTTSGPDFCSGIVKVPAYLPDSQILTQFISNSVDPGTPSPTLHPGDKTNIPTVGQEKNTITVATETILKNNIVVSKIDIKNKSTGTVIKSVVPTVNTTLIPGIPQGTYQILVTKTGYKTSACSATPCEVTFTTDYLGSASVTIILESLVKTCKLTITVTDKYIKPPKTQTLISIDGAAGQIAPNGVLDIPEITAGIHKFTIKADGYKEIVDKSENIRCTTSADAISFALDQTADIIIGSMDLTVDVGDVLDQKGSIKVDKGQAFKIKVSGGNGANPIEIYDISKAPDLLVATIPAGQGLIGTDLVYNEDTTLELQAFQGCILGLCAESSNVLSMTIGTGSPRCAIPGPFGGCLLEQTTGYGMMLLAGLGLVAAITVFGKGGGGTRIIERITIPPHYTPPEIKKDNLSK